MGVFDVLLSPLQSAWHRFQQRPKSEKRKVRQSDRDLQPFHEDTADDNPTLSYAGTWQGNTCQGNEPRGRPRFYSGALDVSTLCLPTETPAGQTPDENTPTNNTPVNEVSVHDISAREAAAEALAGKSPSVTSVAVVSLAPRHPSIRVSGLSIDFEGFMKSPTMESLREHPPITEPERVVLRNPLFSRQDRRKFLQTAQESYHQVLKEIPATDSSISEKPSPFSSKTSSFNGPFSSRQSVSSVTTFSSLKLGEWGQRTLYDIRSVGSRDGTPLYRCY